MPSKVQGCSRAGTRRQAKHQQDGRHRAERQVDEEHAAPAEMMREIAAGDRPERAGRDHHGGQVALIARALARRDGFADKRLRERHQAAAAKTLQDAREASISTLVASVHSSEATRKMPSATNIMRLPP